MKIINKFLILTCMLLLSLSLTACKADSNDELDNNTEKNELEYLTDEQLKDYYDELYGEQSSTDYTDEQLNLYYENLYGTGNNDVTEYEDYTSSNNTIYTFDQSGTYIEYMASNYNKAYMIQDLSKKVTYKTDHQGDLISLITNTGETTFTNGIAIAGAAACFTYTDIREQGYDEFSGYFGAHYLARYVNSSSTSFNFKFMCDGVTVYTTKTFNKDTEAEYVEIDLTEVGVFQIFVEIQGTGTGDYMAMGDPKFTKEEAKPYLYVYDLEFNLPSQVNDFNILEFAVAYDINGNDISENITYETNYVKGSTGTNFDVTYIIKSEVKGEVVERRDTVQMDVYNIDYSQVWSIEDYKTPFVNHLYYARQSYDGHQMQKLFDFVLNEYLDFDDTKWIKKTRSNIYPSQNAQNLNFYSEGIYLKYSDINQVLSGICDSDTRTIIALDLDLMGSYYATVDSTTGLCSKCWFWATNDTTATYETKISAILTNSETLLSYAKDDMTYAIKWKYVIDAYANRITYTDGGSLYNSIGLFKGKCNGNSRGLVYLAQRLSIRSIYANGMSTYGFHAWTYQQLPDNGTWYMTDRLWGSCLASATNHGHQVYTNNGYTFPTISTTAYSSSNYTYPTIWATFNNSSYTIKQGSYIDIDSNVLTLGSIFTDILLYYKITTLIKDENGNIVSSDTSTLSEGTYTIVYTLNYNSDLYDISRSYNISLTISE